jgi:flagellar motor switch protein FliN/FliY
MPEASAPDRPSFVPEEGRSPAGSGPARALRAFGDAFATGAGPALTTRLNRSVSVAVTAVDRQPPTALAAQVPMPWVLLKLPYARGFSGGHTLIVPQAGALALAQAAGGEPAAGGPGLTSASEDALKQTVSEMLTAATATLGPALKRPLSFGPVALTLAEGADALPSDLVDARDPAWTIRFTASSADGFQAQLLLTVPTALAQEIAAAMPVTGAGEPEGLGTDQAAARLDLILDISLPVTVELGRARMQIQDILKLGPGSIIELEKSAGDPVELFINDRPIAKGEVVVIDENFGIRLTSIVTASERIRTLR